MSQMNYDLTKIVDGTAGDMYNHEAMKYGSMPYGMFEAKYETTTAIPANGVYNDYARNLLTDQRPDTNLLTYEEPRGAVNRSAGYLQLRYNGHRGDAYSPYRPEYFDQFMGSEDRDPRGINTDPDFKELSKQEQSRMRFVRFSADGCDQVTGGGISQAQAIENQQKVFRMVRGRLKIFDRQLDGRREGLRRTYQHVSEYSRVSDKVQSYGDVITDQALNVQRTANMICKQVLRDSPAWRAETAEDNFSINQYGQSRRAKKCVTNNTVLDAMNSAEADFTDADATRCYKTAGILMGNLLRVKKQAVDASKLDIDMGSAREAMSKKTAPMVRDIAIVTKSAQLDANLGTSDQTQSRKNATPQLMEHLARTTATDGSLPAHHYLNAEIMYKAVKPGADTRKASDQIITDQNDPTLINMSPQAKRAAKREIASGAKLNTDDDTDKAEHMRTFNYKKAVQCNGDKRSRLTSEDGYSGVSDVSQVRRPAKWNYRVEQPNDTVMMSEFGANSSLDRHGGAMGSKYMNRFIDRDGRDGLLAEVF